MENQQTLINSKLAEAQRCRDNAKLSPAQFQPGLLAVCDQIAAEANAIPSAASVGTDYARYWDMTATGQNPNLVSAENWNKFTGQPAPVAAPASTPVPVAVKSVPVVVNSSGAQNAPQRSAAVESPASALSGLPWYVWAGGAAVVVMIARGGGR